MPRLLRLLGAAAATTLVAVPAASRAEPTFLGVAACSSIVCHGSVVARKGANVLQNEYRTWSATDRHARAFETLQTKRSRAIAANLGIEAAHSAALCLDCHATHAPAAERGPEFQLEDGVGCESCHGASAPWIESHEDAGRTHEQNLAAGMIATDEPVRRAELCSSCHLGSNDKAVTHRIMAAGHPRLSFELDTFTHLQPAHFRTDTDYAKRKGVRDGAVVWAVGQAVALREYLTLLAAGERSSGAAWPEFALFDCFSCHHPIGSAPGSTASAGGALLGTPRFERSGALLYAHLLAVLAPERTADLAISLEELATAMVTADANASTKAASLRDRAAAAVALFDGWQADGDDLRALVARIASADGAREYVTYTDAEQVTMAVQALFATADAGKLVDADTLARWSAGLDRLFEATANADVFRAHEFRKALADLR